MYLGAQGWRPFDRSANALRPDLPKGLLSVSLHRRHRRRIDRAPSKRGRSRLGTRDKRACVAPGIGTNSVASRLTRHGTPKAPRWFRKWNRQSLPRRYFGAPDANDCPLVGSFCAASPERIHYPLHRGMRPVLQLYPMLGPPSFIGPIPALRHQPCQPHATRNTEIRANVAVLELGNEEAIRSTRQHPDKIGLAHRQRQAGHVGRRRRAP